jgi:hypothetical protein
MSFLDGLTGDVATMIRTARVHRLLENGDFAGLFFTDCRHSVNQAPLSRPG